MTAVCFTIATKNSPVVKSVAITFGDRGKISDTRKNGNNTDEAREEVEENQRQAESEG